MAQDAVGLLESRLAEAGFVHVAGADEVGRGALAGPLVAAAVILPVAVELPGVRDSKLCTPQQREQLARRIREVAVSVAIVRVSPEKIDRIGLQRCNLEALKRAVKNLSVTPEYVVLDGFRPKRLSWPGLRVVKADVVSRNVAAASIVAKVHRDRSMRRYHRRFPQYGFITNVGYATPEHWAALDRFGPSAIHRRSFHGVTPPEEDGVFEGPEARNFYGWFGPGRGENG